MIIYLDHKCLWFNPLFRRATRYCLGEFTLNNRTIVRLFAIFDARVCQGDYWSGKTEVIIFIGSKMVHASNVFQN